MTQALTVSQQSLPAHLAGAASVAMGYIRESKSAATRRAYASDCRAFVAWCTENDCVALPASPEVVCMFLGQQAEKGAKYSTISRKAAAINYAHVTAALDSPTKSHLVSSTLEGIRRNLGVAPTKKAPATAAKLIEMVRYCPDTLQGKRDKALLLLGFAGAFRRSELVALTVSDIAEEAAGLKVVIRRSKTDQDGAGQTIAIARGEVFCPVAAVAAWLEAAGITEGPVFRSVSKSGRASKEALSTKSVAGLVKAYARRAGFNPEEFAGHSLRAGFLTSAAEAGASIFKMMDVSRHRSMDTVRGYVRNAELFKNHAGAGLL